MLDLQPVVERIKTGVREFRQVGMAADFAAALANMRTPSEGFVLPLGDRPGKNQLAGTAVIEQTVTESFGFAFAARNVSDMQGGRAQEELLALRLAVKNLMVGWAGLSGNPITRSQGRLLKLDTDVIWWLDTYETYYLEKTNA